MLPFEKINTAVSNLLAQTPNPTDEDIRTLALELAIRDYEDAIRTRLGSVRTNQALSEIYAKNVYFAFVEPEKPPKVITEGKQEVVYEKEPRQEYRVKQVDLPAFCKRFGLDMKAMTAVGMGERRDHKGWIRCNRPGSGYLLGNVYRQPQPIDPPLKSDQKQVRVVRLWSLPAIEWVPEN